MYKKPRNLTQDLELLSTVAHLGTEHFARQKVCSLTLLPAIEKPNYTSMNVPPRKI